MLKNFLTYQLINQRAGDGSGVGCGYYDLSGQKDQHNISIEMNQYMFEVCFDLDSDLAQINAEHFMQFCLSNFSSNLLSDDSANRFGPTKQGLLNEFDESRFLSYWLKNSKKIKEFNFEKTNKKVVTYNYEISYAIGVPKVYDVLDSLLESHNVVT